MARIKTVAPDEAGPDVQQAIQYTRMGIAQLAGRETERMTEPLELYAHLPRLLRGVGVMAQATSEFHGLTPRHHTLAHLKAATLTNCEYCIDLGSQVSRRCGLTDAELLALPTYRTSDLFDEVDKLVLDYAVGM